MISKRHFNTDETKSCLDRINATNFSGQLAALTTGQLKYK